MCIPMTYEEWTFIRVQLSSVSTSDKVDIESLRAKVIKNQTLAESREFVNRGKK